MTGSKQTQELGLEGVPWSPHADSLNFSAEAIRGVVPRRLSPAALSSLFLEYSYWLFLFVSSCYSVGDWMAGLAHARSGLYAFILGCSSLMLDKLYSSHCSWLRRAVPFVGESARTVGCDACPVDHPSH